MVSILISAGFFLAGILLASNFKGFAETTFNFLSKTNPMLSHATHKSLRVLGVLWTVLGGLFLFLQLR